MVLSRSRTIVTVIAIITGLGLAATSLIVLADNQAPDQPGAAGGGEGT